MIVLSTLETESVLGQALLINTNEEDTNFGNASRRQTRVATLDGGSVLQDRGFSNSDLTFVISAKEFSEGVFESLRYLVESFPEVRISTRIGSFIGTIRNLSDEDASFDFWVTSND